MELTDKKITLSVLMEMDKIDTEKIQVRRAIISKLKREIDEDEGLLQPIELPSDDTSVLNQKQKRDFRELAKKTALEYLTDQKKPVRLSDIQEHVNEKLGIVINIREFLRSMQLNRKIKLMKINSNNRLAFWVKPDWIDKDNNTLYDEYKTDILLDNLDDKITFE